jgi:hypothetical protein
VRKHRSFRRSLAPFAVGVGVWLLLPAQAFARALIRFIHAVPGVGTATVKVDGETVGSIGFGQVTPWRSVRSGSFHWSLTAGGKTLVSGSATVGSAAYDIVVLDKPSGVALGLYRARDGRPGTSLLRVIHAAPELGAPELMLDAKPAVASLAFTQATPYLSITPGVHTLSAVRRATKTPLVSGAHVRLVPDRAYSAIVVGSRGQMVRVVTVVDKGAPLIRHGHGHSAASAPASSPGGSHAGSIVVKPGDSLWSIARGLLPAEASNAQIEHKLVRIWDLNAGRIGTGDPNLIFPGQRLVLS